MWIFHQLFISIVAAKQKESKPVGDGTELARKTGKGHEKTPLIAHKLLVMPNH